MFSQTICLLQEFHVNLELIQIWEKLTWAFEKVWPGFVELHLSPFVIRAHTRLCTCTRTTWFIVNLEHHGLSAELFGLRSGTSDPFSQVHFSPQKAERRVRGLRQRAPGALPVDSGHVLRQRALSRWAGCVRC